MPAPHCFITMALQYNSKSGVVIPLALLFLLRIALFIQVLPCFHASFGIDFSISVNNIGILIGTTLNP
jgi:hypothetical protein